jgi:photosystem II stability/assembly factor-like uncharacterized protein
LFIKEESEMKKAKVCIFLLIGMCLLKTSVAAVDLTKVSIYGGEIDHAAISVSSPTVIYAGAMHGGLWVSKDSGAKWARTTMWSSNNSGSGMFAVHPQYPGTIVAVASESGRLLYSEDYGQTWSEKTFVYENSISVMKIAYSQLNKDKCFLLGNTSAGGVVYKSTDDGKTWTKMENFNSNGKPTVDLCIDINEYIYVSATNGTTMDFPKASEAYSGVLYKSAIGAADSWSEVSTLSPGANTFAWHLSATLNTLTVGTEGNTPKLWVSTDAAGNFSEVSTISPTYGFSIGIASDGNSIFYNNSNDRIVKSTFTAGSGWSTPVIISSGVLNGDTRISNSSLLIDSSNANNMYIGDGYEHAFFKSTDAGATWAISNTGLDALQVKDGCKNAQGYLYVMSRASIHKSINSGASWTKVYGYNPGAGTNTGFDGGAIAVSPDSTKDYVYAAGKGNLWRSIDGGQTWAVVLTFSNDYLPADIVLNPDTPAVGYIAFSNSATTGETSAKYIYKTTDYGANWSLVDLTGMGVHSLVMDPADSTVLYAGLGEIAPWSMNTYAFGGLWKIIDTGSSISWSKIGLDSMIPYRIAIDTTNSNTIAAACIDNLSSQSGPVYASYDAGATWQKTCTPEEGETDIWTMSGGAFDLKFSYPAVYFSHFNGLYACVDGGQEYEVYEKIAARTDVGSIECIMLGSIYAGTTTGLWKVGEWIPGDVAVAAGSIKIQGGAKGYVNPAIGEKARIHFNAKKAGKVTVKVYTKKGRLVWEDSKDSAGGEDFIDWACKNAKDNIVASGVYIVYVEGPGVKDRKMMAIVK